MKHILSTITVLFILLSSSVSWSKEVGYGDLRIGSDKSVIDEHCKLKHSWGFNLKCYQLEDVDFIIEWNDNNKITSIRMDWFGYDSSETFKHSSFEEFLKNP